MQNPLIFCDTFRPTKTTPSKYPCFGLFTSFFFSLPTYNLFFFVFPESIVVSLRRYLCCFCLFSSVFSLLLVSIGCCCFYRSSSSVFAVLIVRFHCLWLLISFVFIDCCCCNHLFSSVLLFSFVFIGTVSLY